MKKQMMIVFGLMAVLLSACGQNKDYVEVAADIADSFPIAAEPVAENPQMVESAGPYALLHTTAGDITILLYPEQAPKAVENFISLAEEGYYDGTLFHYAKRDELVQTGIPAAAGVTERSTWGEPFEDELNRGLYNFAGAVGMAGMGDNNNLSQFYLLTKDTAPEDERVLPATLYMNELIQIRTQELNERGEKKALTEAEIQQFEADLNAEIQAINTDGVPAEYAKKYEPIVERYNQFGGSSNLDNQYTVFGQIVDGLNVAEAITQVKVNAEDRKPKQDVVIESIEIRE